jgi:hypothetical protein
MDEIIDELFGDTKVASTPEIARAFGLSERDARAWAEELGVGKIGARTFGRTTTPKRSPPSLKSPPNSTPTPTTTATSTRATTKKTATTRTEGLPARSPPRWPAASPLPARRAVQGLATFITVPPK